MALFFKDLQIICSVRDAPRARGRKSEIPRRCTTLREQIGSNLEWAWEITGGTEDQLTRTMVQISQVVARELKTQQ
jgi:hypothetical protein